MSPALHAAVALPRLPSADALGVTLMLEWGGDARQTKGCASKGTKFTSFCKEPEDPDLGEGFSVMSLDMSHAGAGWDSKGRCRAWGSIPVLLSMGLCVIVSDSGIFRCISRYA